MTGSPGPPGGQWLAGQSAKQALTPMSKPLLTPAQRIQFLKQISAAYTTGKIILNGTSTGNPTTKPIYSRENEVTKTTKRHSKGYYYVISVNDTDDVFYEVYNGGKLAHLLCKIIGRSPLNINENHQYSSVRKRTHLPATVGATYLEIDKEIEAHKATLEHDSYAKGILAAEPDGLKMIEGLEKLAEGDPDDDKFDPNITVAAPTGQAQYSNNLSMGSFYAKDSP